MKWMFGPSEVSKCIDEIAKFYKESHQITKSHYDQLLEKKKIEDMGDLMKLVNPVENLTDKTTRLILSMKNKVDPIFSEVLKTMADKGDLQSLCKISQICLKI